MSDILIFSPAAGLCAGLLFYGGLWLTVKHIIRARLPLPAAMVSLFVRLAGAAAVFYFLARGGRWDRVIAGLAGFTAARFAVMLVIPQHTEQEYEHKS